MSDVTIVWNADKGDIISRFALALSRQTNWPISRKPDPKAGINYFPLYIQVGQSPQGIKGLSKTAALFSHYETDIPKKAAWWDSAAELVDIRLTWAEQYLSMLLPYGESHIVIPPLDPQFQRAKPRVGICGYVHPGGRKGEGLIERLHKQFGHVFEIVASGAGWPVPNVKERDWADMPEFYKSLDVYLLTSTIEGIPMTPIEALAMGTPVVIPYGVGLLDSLSHPQIYRYQAGDFDSMASALEQATGAFVKHLDHFSESAWAESHRAAFGLNAGSEIITRERGGVVKSGVPYIIQEPAVEMQNRGAGKKPYNAPVLRDLSRDEGQAVIPTEKRLIPASGAVVVAYGKPARECAQIAISSWRQFMPEYPIALVSDEPLGIESLFIKHPDTDIGARSVKTQLYDLTPPEWNNVLYLDADTEIVAPVPSLFQWLEMGWDFLICVNPGLYASITQGARPDNREELEVTIAEIGSGEFIQANGGVFGFKRGDAGAALMRGWHSEWLRWKARDQFALLRALHKNPVKLLLLGNEFNTIVRFCDPSITAGIIHYALRARRWAGIIQGPLDSQEAWDRVIE